ncbi:MAG: radical SAM family heme chaperone HemW [Actinomycetota bacterium]
MSTGYRIPDTEYSVSPDSVELAEQARSWKSAYVHIPFCAQRCPYCDFAVVAADEPGGDEAARYVEAILAEIAMEDTPFPLDAVNFGGGTPTRVDASDLGRILGALDQRFGIADDAEVSIEANPEDWSPTYGDALLSAGFNRVSFGVQSFDPVVLNSLGRTHSPDEAESAVRAARESGFDTVNLDLIYGAPAETNDSWSATVDRALGLGPDHLSAYALTVEGGTALSRAIRGGAPSPDPDVQADRYEYVDAAARAAGFVRYEVSNWARPGRACLYNLSTWMMGEFLAFGTGAHDYRDGARGRNIRRLDAYLSKVESGERPRSGSERLDDFESERERFMVGLRLAAGVALGSIGGPFVECFDGGRLLDAGIVRVDGDRVVVERPLLTDLVARSVLSVSPGDC